MHLKNLENDRLREVISYLFWGCCTTAVNFIIYFLGYKTLALPSWSANTIAWFLSVLFAFVTNRHFVFRSKSKGLAVLKEGGSFFASRAATGALDIGMLFVMVDVMAWPAFWMKLIVEVIIVVLNYVFSKLVVFRRKKKETE